MTNPTSYALAVAKNAEASHHRTVAKKPVIGLSTTRKLKTISAKCSFNLFILRLEPNTQINKINDNVLDELREKCSLRTRGCDHQNIRNEA